MKKLLVVNFNDAGVGKYRLLDPHIKLSEISKDFEVHFGDDQDLVKLSKKEIDFDLLFVHSSIAPDPNRMKTINVIRNNGVKIIVDVDDYWILDTKNPISKSIRKNEYHKKIIAFLKLADLVTTTTDFLANEVRKFQKNVSVIPNAIDPNEKQFKPNKTQSDKIRIGYLGGSSHLYDIRMLREGINRIHSTYKDRVQFVLCGFNDAIRDIASGKVVNDAKRSVWSEYEQIFTANYSKISEDYKKYLLSYSKEDYPLLDEVSYRRVWTKPISTYASGYNLFDISLAPLVDNKFNIMKSQLKIIESGFHKTPIIASNVKPYQIDLIHQKNALLVDEKKSKKDWFKNMKLLIDNESMRVDLTEALYETVKDKFDLENVTILRNEIYKSL